MKHQGLTTSSTFKLFPFWREEYTDRVEVVGWITLLLLLLLSSCSQEPTQPELPVGTPVSVTADLHISVCPIVSLNSESTRAEVNKSAAEKEIKSAYVVQFSGTSAASTAVWVSGDVSGQLKTNLPVPCSMTLTKGTMNRVYVVANLTTIPTLGMTLESLEKTVPYTVSASLPSTGLPMVAFQDVDSDESFGLFLLKSPLARLTFKTSVGTLTLCGIPSAYSLAPVTVGDVAVRPSGVTYTTTATLTSGTAYYVPANLSGRVALSDKILRCTTFAPANSMYVMVSANNTTYTFYLGDGSASDFNVMGNYAYKANTIISGTDNSFDMRIGTPPAITALDGSGTANCYIATAANKWYSFNGKVMGNGKSTPLPSNLASGSVASAITPSPLNPVSTDVLWETWNTASTPVKGSVVQGVYLADGKVIFRSGTSQGNAVIAARDSENNIIWSWHIWRKNNDPTASTFTFPAYTSTLGNFDDTGTTSHEGLTMMTYNLGALSNTSQDNLSTGLHYQWGRKDPLPGGANLAVRSLLMATNPIGIQTVVSSGVSTGNAIANPTKYYLGNGNDWCISRNDNRWGTALTRTVKINDYTYNSNPGSKSIFDPCPVGWRVGPAYVYALLTVANFPWNTFGRSYNSVWFPGSGLWNYDDGVFGYVGLFGSYWTSSPCANYPVNGSPLNFNSTNSVTQVSSGRPGGNIVRCVKE